MVVVLLGHSLMKRLRLGTGGEKQVGQVEWKHWWVQQRRSGYTLGINLYSGAGLKV